MSKICIAHLRSLSPYTFSRMYSVEKLDKESADEFERRTWRERCHYTPDGELFLPPMGFKFSLDTSAKLLREKIPGKRGSEWGKIFKSGILVMEGMRLGIKKDEINGVWLPMNANGVRGSGTRVNRCMPTLQSWEGTVTYYLLNSVINEDVFSRHLKESGNFVGIGQFRPETGGFHGRFEIVGLKFQNL